MGENQWLGRARGATCHAIWARDWLFAPPLLSIRLVRLGASIRSVMGNGSKRMEVLKSGTQPIPWSESQVPRIQMLRFQGEPTRTVQEALSHFQGVFGADAVGRPVGQSPRSVLRRPSGRVQVPGVVDDATIPHEGPVAFGVGSPRR